METTVGTVSNGKSVFLLIKAAYFDSFSDDSSHVILIFKILRCSQKVYTKLNKIQARRNGYEYRSRKTKVTKPN